METTVLCLMAAVVAITLLFLLVKRTPKQGELLRIKEPPMTAWLGLVLWVEAGIVLYFLLTQPEHLVVSQQGRINAYIFLLVSAVFGGIMILYCFKKVILVFPDQVVYVSLFGQQETLRWEEIDQIKTTQSKRLTLIHKGGTQFTVGGKTEDYREFVKLASKKIPPEAGEDILQELRLRLKI
jgi:hypothetical protein